MYWEIELCMHGLKIGTFAHDKTLTSCQYRAHITFSRIWSRKLTPLQQPSQSDHGLTGKRILLETLVGGSG